MTIIRSIFVLCLLTTFVFGQNPAAKNSYESISLKELSGSPAEYEGRLVIVTGELISVDAGFRRLDIFDQNGKVLIVVNIEQLTMSQRESLLADPVRRVTVNGRVELKNGQLTIRAQKLVALVNHLSE